MERSELNKLQSKWLNLDESVVKRLEDIRSEEAEAIQHQKFESLKAI